MKSKSNPKFPISPKWEDCFKVVFPVNLKVGMIFTKQTKRKDYDEYILHNFLRKVTKVEPLLNHPNHIVISSILVGATVTKDIFEKERSLFLLTWNDKKSKSKFAVTEYFDENHVNKETCIYTAEERTEIFFISTNGQDVYYKVDTYALELVKVPIEDERVYLGY